MLSLYDEEKEALRDVSGLMNAAIDAVARFVYARSSPNIPYRTNLESSCKNFTDKLKMSMDKHWIFIDGDIFASIEELLHKTMKIFHSLVFSSELDEKLEKPDTDIQENPELYLVELLKRQDRVLQKLREHLQDKKNRYLSGE